MPDELYKPEKMYELLNGTFMSNPMIDCCYDSERSSIIVRQFVGPQSRQAVHIVPWDGGGNTVITIPFPGIEVPEDAVGHMAEFLYRCNQRLERGIFVMTEDNCILFRTYLPCREGDILSVKTVMEEVNLGIRMFMSYMDYIIRAIDGEEYDDIFEGRDKGSNAIGAVPTEDNYVPASERDVSEKNGGMYA